MLHFAPADISGKEVCPQQTQACTRACLNTAGRGGTFNKGEATDIIQQARIRSTKALVENRQELLNQPTADILKTAKKTETQNLTPLLRWNGASDSACQKYEVCNGNNMT